MKFYDGQVFHIYNQGNNRRDIFLEERNYEFFIWKMKAYLNPFGDLIAWCLMPNHFHWLFYVNRVDILRSELRDHVDQIEWQRREATYGLDAQSVDFEKFRIADSNNKITLNQAIGHLQCSYTRAINEQEKWSGSLFRSKCKAKDGWKDDLAKINFNSFNNGPSYIAQCLFYIHQNPVKANLVSQDIDWEYSSAKEYYGLGSYNISNTNLGLKILEG